MDKCEVKAVRVSKTGHHAIEGNKLVAENTYRYDNVHHSIDMRSSRGAPPINDCLSVMFGITPGVPAGVPPV